MVIFATQTIGDKIVKALEGNCGEQNHPHPSPPPPTLHSKFGCLLFSSGSSNSGTTLQGGDGGLENFIFSFLSQQNITGRRL